MPTIPGTAGWWFGAVLATCLAGCGDAGPSRAPIQGLVTVGGRPLAAGRILFLPQAPSSGPAATARIADGAYELTEADGPVVGPNRVEIEADPPLGFALDNEAAFAKSGRRSLPPSPLPASVHRESTLTVQVRAGVENRYDVAIPAAARR